MIVSISGVSCTGKTTLITELQKMGYPVITPSASRMASGFEFPTGVAKDRYIFDVGHRQLIEAKNISDSTGKVVFLDRSQFDNWTFRYVYGGDLSYEYLFKEDLKLIDFTWILDPKDVPFVSDGVRPEDLPKREQWHKLMIEKAKEQHMEFDILSGSVADRLMKIGARLKHS